MRCAQSRDAHLRYTHRITLFVPIFSYDHSSGYDVYIPWPLTYSEFGKGLINLKKYSTHLKFKCLEHTIWWFPFHFMIKLFSFFLSEPAILVMHHSMKSHPAITATLLDFLCRVSTKVHICNFHISFKHTVNASVLQLLDFVICR